MKWAPCLVFCGATLLWQDADRLQSLLDESATLPDVSRPQQAVEDYALQMVAPSLDMRGADSPTTLAREYPAARQPLQAPVPMGALMQQMPALPEAAAAAPAPVGTAPAARQLFQAPVPTGALMQQMPAFPEVAGAAVGDMATPGREMLLDVGPSARAPLGAPQGSPLGFGVDMSLLAAPRAGRPAEAPAMLPPVAIETPEQMALPPVPPSGDDSRFTNSEATRAFIQSLRGPGPSAAAPAAAGPGNSLLQGASGAGGLQRWMSYFSSANDSVRAREQR